MNNEQTNFSLLTNHNQHPRYMRIILISIYKPWRMRNVHNFHNFTSLIIKALILVFRCESWVVGAGSNYIKSICLLLILLYAFISSASTQLMKPLLLCKLLSLLVFHPLLTLFCSQYQRKNNIRKPTIMFLVDVKNVGV